MPGGRPKGSKNKLPRDLALKVVAIAEQLEEDGKGLADEAEKDPKWFYANFVKSMLPKEYKITGDEDSPVISKVIIEHVKGSHYTVTREDS